MGERGVVDGRREGLPLPDRRDTAEHVPRRALHPPGVGERTALSPEPLQVELRRRRHDCDRQGSVEVDDERLEDPARLDPEAFGRLETVGLDPLHMLVLVDGEGDSGPLRCGYRGRSGHRRGR